MTLEELQQLRQQGIDYERQGLYEDALLNLYRVFNASEDHPEFKVQAALDLGVLYRMLEKYTAADEMFEIVEQNSQAKSVHRFTAYLERAVIGYRQKDLGGAEQALAMAEEVLEQNEMGRLIVYFLITRALVEIERKEFQKGLEILRQSMTFVELFKSRFLRCTVLSNIGHCYMQMGNYDEARTNLLESLSLAEEIGKIRRVAEVNCTLAVVALKEDDLASAKHYAAVSFQISYEQKYRDIIRDLCYQIGRYYRNSGEEAIAEVFFEKAVNADHRLTTDFLKLLDTDRMSSGEGVYE
jgi:tetratricopeptide (TPR) repeat protein